MKVEGTGVDKFRFKSSKKNQAQRQAANLTFSSALDEAQNSGLSSTVSEENIQTVIESIQELGERLLQNPSSDTVASYKQSVRNFLASIGKQAFAIEEHQSRKDIVNQKKYVLVRRVNENLDKLMHNVLLGQKKQINLLSTIEEIQGLLVNLIHIE